MGFDGLLTKDERACMQSCYGRLGSDLVWSMSQDQTVCLEVGQPCLDVKHSGSLIVLTKHE